MSRKFVVDSVWISILLLAGISACTKGSPDSSRPTDPSTTPPTQVTAEGPFRFVDVASELGITRVTWGGRPGKDHLLDSAGTGAAWLDYDKDGRLDAYIINCWKMEGSTITERGKNALYRQREDGKFEDVTDSAGVGGEGNWGAGAFAVDYDDDGWTDIFVTNFGPSLLYRNKGDGKFENVAARLGIEAPGWNSGAAWFDADGDRDLDVFFAGYIDCTLDEVLKATCNLDWKGLEMVAYGPFGLKGAKDHFFRAQGKDRFTDETIKAGLQDLALGFGFAVRAADFDNDGDLDLYVANDSDPNYLYRNEGDGTFKEMAVWAGCAMSAAGASQASMGVSVADFDGDTNLDIVVTNFSEDSTTLYRGTGDGFFDDLTTKTNLESITFRPLSWGTALADLDCDGDMDLVIVNGHIYPQIDRHPEIVGTYAQKNLLLENRDGAFFDVTAQAGPGFQLIQSSRALAVGDYDNDGDLDLLITHLDAAPTLLRNDSRSGSWLTVVCEVPPGGGPLIGTRVTVTCGGKKYLRDIAAGDSYMSTHDFRCHFGLGKADRVEKVDVEWPDGTHSTLEGVPARQFLKVRKGS